MRRPYKQNLRNYGCTPNYRDKFAQLGSFTANLRVCAEEGFGLGLLHHGQAIGLQLLRDGTQNGSLC